MYKAEVFTHWHDADKPNRIHLFSVLKGEGFSFSGNDITGQQEVQPAPNVLVVEIFCSDEVITFIEDHPDYGEAAILLTEEM